MRNRMLTAAPVLLAAAAALAIAACSSTAATGTDAGTDAPASETSADVPATGCDPVAQDCAAGQKCDFGCQGSAAALSCMAGADGGAIGSTCTTATPCARGGACLTAPDAGSLCRKYCAGDGDCATGERCHNVTVTIGCGASSAPTLPLHYCY